MNLHLDGVLLMKKKFIKKDVDLHCAATKALLEKRKLTYTELLDLTAQSMLWVKIRDEENKILNKRIDDYSLIISKFRVIVEEMAVDSQSIFEQTKLKALLDGIELQKKQRAKSAATARHKNNRLMKDQVIQHYIDNVSTFTSKDDAAFKMAENIVSAKFSTVRDWLKGVKAG